MSWKQPEYVSYRGGRSDLDPGDPLESLAGDTLGLEPVARQVAAALGSLPCSASTVLAISGPWGSGKTSVKNVAITEARSARRGDQPDLATVEFNPWLYDSAEQLAREFFAEIGAAAFTADATREGREARARLWRYAMRVTQVTAIGAGAVAPIAGVALGALAKGAEQAAKAMEHASEACREASAPYPVSDLRAKLRTYFRNRKTPILVVVDDIDRLVPDEVRLMFRLVKACADFPNLHFLLLYDREHVERALEPGAQGPGPFELGRRFVEKIVTAQFDIPDAPEESLSDMLEHGLHELCARQCPEAPYNADRWARLARYVLLLRLKTPREARRFLTALRFSALALTDGGGLNADVLDLVAVEFLRMFFPEHLGRLRAVGLRLSEDQLQGTSPSAEDHETVLREVLGVRTHDGDVPIASHRAAAAQAAVEFLHASPSPMVDIYTEFCEEGTTSPRLFRRASYRDVYLALDPQRCPLPEALLRPLMGAPPEADAMSRMLDTLCGDDPVPVLSVICDHVARFPNVDVFVREVLRWAGRRPHFTTARDPFSPWARAAISVVLMALESLRGNRSAAGVLVEGARHANSWVCAAGIALFAAHPGSSVDPFAASDVVNLHSTVASGLQATVESGQVWDAADPAAVFACWDGLSAGSSLGWADAHQWREAEARSYLEHVIAPFLSVGSITGQTSYVAAYLPNPRAESILQACAEIDRDQLSPRSLAALEWLLSAGEAGIAEPE